METPTLKKSVEEWLVELNDPQANHRRDSLNDLSTLGALDDRLVNELKLMARGDPDAKTQSLAKKMLQSRGINIFPQVSYQSSVQQKRSFLSLDFLIGFFLFPILNFISYFALLSVRNAFSLCFAVNIVCLIFFWFIRKNIALGILAGFVLFGVILPICLWLYICPGKNGCANL
jgi:hypothetical protein